MLNFLKTIQDESFCNTELYHSVWAICTGRIWKLITSQNSCETKPSFMETYKCIYGLWV